MNVSRWVEHGEAFFNGAKLLALSKKTSASAQPLVQLCGPGEDGTEQVTPNTGA